MPAQAEYFFSSLKGLAVGKEVNEFYQDTIYYYYLLGII